MPAFAAKIANLVGWGEKVTKRRDGSWARDKFRFDLDGHAVTIRQRKAMLTRKRSDVRGRFVETSTVRLGRIKSFEEGELFVHDLCSLLSFATQSRVVAY